MTVEADIYCGVVPKHPDDVCWLEFDFGDLPEIAAGARIASADIPAVSGVTIAAVTPLPAGNAYKVGAWFSGGTDLSDYRVKCTVTLNDARPTVRSREGDLAVRKTRT